MTLITREQPASVRDELEALHQAAFSEVETFGDIDVLEGEPLIFVAWDDDHKAIGYVVATLPAVGEVEVWEHLVHPEHRYQGLGRKLMHELARSCDPGTGLQLDPTGQLDPERAGDYYRTCGFQRRDASGHLWATAAAVRIATADESSSAAAGSTA
jgi:GNAT superfamily N-acetyltransferase